MKFDGSRPGPGRPKGSRNKLSEAFLRDFCEAWEERGKAALEAVATTDPSTFIKVTAQLLPAKLEAEVGHRYVVRMPHVCKTNEEWLASIAAETPIEPLQ
jgi:hypothetical protein